MFLNVGKKENEEKRKAWSLKKRLSVFGITIIGVIAIVLLVLSLMRKPENSKRANVNIDPELRRAMTYPQFEEGS